MQDIENARKCPLGSAMRDHNVSIRQVGRPVCKYKTTCKFRQGYVVIAVIRYDTGDRCDANNNDLFLYC